MLRYILLMLIVLVGGCSQHQAGPPVVSCPCLDFTATELTQLRNITIVQRGSSPYRYIYRAGHQKFNLPIIDSLDSFEEIAASGEFDITGFARQMRIDSTDVQQFVRSSSATVKRLFERCDCTEIFSDTTLGDFISFKVAPSTELIYLDPSGSISHPLWVKFFDDQAHQIRENWYIRRPPVSG